VLDWVEVENVRNLARQRVSLASMVVVSGANAQGKSSFLEAAYLLATTRSFRVLEPREAITHGADWLGVRGALTTGSGVVSEVGIGLGKARGERTLVVGQSDAKLAEYLGLLPTLALAGDSLRSIAGSPAERRRFTDRATAAADPAHLGDLGQYRRALAQRNQLLRSGAPDRELEAFEVVLARSGERLARRRARQVEAWQSEIGSWPDLFPEGTAARLKYRRAGLDGRAPAGRELEDEDAGDDGNTGGARRLAEKLAAARAKDRLLARTSVGPHRDDLAIEVQGVDLLRFGSAGQVRSALSALTLAQARTVRASRGGEPPLLVLDDVDTDLDAGRLAALLRAAAAEGQVLAASSKQGLAPPDEAMRLRAVNGSIT
jgi:DNA replication and repair protein RecF